MPGACLVMALILLIMLCLGQDATKVPSDFSTLQKQSVEELKVKTRAHIKTWGLGKIERWDLSQDTGQLIFSLPDGFKAVTPAQIIGSYNSKDHTWLWAWANSSIDETFKADALKLREYGEEHKIERLTKAKWVGKKKTRGRWRP